MILILNKSNLFNNILIIKIKTRYLVLRINESVTTDKKMIFKIIQNKLIEKKSILNKSIDILRMLKNLLLCFHLIASKIFSFYNILL